MTTINLDRGEVGLALDGRVFPMLPSMAAINAIESQIGAVAALLGRAGRLTFLERSVIAVECIRAAGAERDDKNLVLISQARVCEMIYEEGLTDELLATFSVLLANICSGGTKRKKKPLDPPLTSSSESPTAS